MDKKITKKNKTVSVGNFSMNEKHLEDPMVKMLLAANKNNQIRGMDDIVKMLNGKE
jgi:hypothetical protein